MQVAAVKIDHVRHEDHLKMAALLGAVCQAAESNHFQVCILTPSSSPIIFIDSSVIKNPYCIYKVGDMVNCHFIHFLLAKENMLKG
ncbi:hypothetical protein D1839_13025 [Roseburia sp. 1XD42-34]|nr:hypothetical protein [Roseburia sp. 1XD42-34]RKI76387.1 hypothetical protein D7V87_13650 [Clostridium sp. 1xD42-85]